MLKILHKNKRLSQITTDNKPTILTQFVHNTKRKHKHLLLDVDDGGQPKRYSPKVVQMHVEILICCKTCNCCSAFWYR